MNKNNKSKLSKEEFKTHFSLPWSITGKRAFKEIDRDKIKKQLEKMIEEAEKLGWEDRTKTLKKMLNNLKTGEKND
jgi:signal transduction histidine kinase